MTQIVEASSSFLHFVGRGYAAPLGLGGTGDIVLPEKLDEKSEIHKIAKSQERKLGHGLRSFARQHVQREETNTVEELGNLHRGQVLPQKVERLGKVQIHERVHKPVSPDAYSNHAVSGSVAYGSSGTVMEEMQEDQFAPPQNKNVRVDQFPKFGPVEQIRQKHQARNLVHTSRKFHEAGKT